MNAKHLSAKRESKLVEFKSTFEPDDNSEWCELIKDLAALANSGGGSILVGVENDGNTVGGKSVAKVLALDPAVITDKVAKYTGAQFDGFSVDKGLRDGIVVAVIAIRSALTPLVFEKPGTYVVADNKQKSAFGAGTLYVRHGAKSAPATTADVARLIERHTARVRKEWMSGVRKVVNAPSGATVSVLPPAVVQSSAPGATPIRITEDPSAPEYRIVDPDQTHPWRQKELLAEVNSHVPGTKAINSFDLRAIRHLYAVDDNDAFYYRSKFGTPQYSPAFAKWLLDQFTADSRFFEKTRSQYQLRDLL